jgi:hypothetical protein
MGKSDSVTCSMVEVLDRAGTPLGTCSAIWARVVIRTYSAGCYSDFVRATRANHAATLNLSAAA